MLGLLGSRSRKICREMRTRKRNAKRNRSYRILKKRGTVDNKQEEANTFGKHQEMVQDTIARLAYIKVKQEYSSYATVFFKTETVSIAPGYVK